MDASQINALFSKNYEEARSKFIQTATSKGLEVESYILDIKGVNGETLATDVVYDGPRDASKLLVVISGVHGVEGFCGSGVQVGLLNSELSKPSDTAILYIHAVNPHGFSFLRRVTQENVDPNRNFLNFFSHMPENKGYAELHEALLPKEWPPTPENEKILEAFKEKNGAKKLQQAITTGQHQFPDGLWFGGISPTWSNNTLRSILHKYAFHTKLIASIDIHTGLGPYGLGEKIFASFDNEVLTTAQSWWGEVTNVNTGSSTSVPMAGPIQVAIHQESPDAKHIGICLEYGTYPFEEMINSLRADHWAYRYGKYDTPIGNDITQNLKNIFYPNKLDWKVSIFNQAYTATKQALSGLSSYKFT